MDIKTLTMRRAGLSRTVLLLVLVGLGVSVLFFWRSGRDRAYVNLPPSGGRTWVAFGDSLTSGVGAGAGEDYPARLSALLRVPIIRSGVSGETASDGLRRVDNVLQLQPRVVLLCLGGNDSLQRLPAEETFETLGAIIDHVHGRGAFVVLLGVRSATLIDGYGHRFEKLARQKRVLLVPDILDGVVGRPALMSDPIHPNEDGYQYIAARIAQALEPFMERLR